MSDFHPESWNPAWNVATIIQGLQSFMASNEVTTGGITTSDAERKRLADASAAFNNKNFPSLFGGNVADGLSQADKVREQAEASTKTKTGDGSGTISSGRNRGSATRATNSKPMNDANDDVGEGPATEDLTPEEVEKRRKRNAKKRAKKKVKKAAASGEADTPTTEK